MPYLSQLVDPAAGQVWEVDIYMGSSIGNKFKAQPQQGHHRISDLVHNSVFMSVRAPRKGENYELSVDLNSEYREKRKDAIKRTIASMTVGKGVHYHYLL